MLEVTDSGGCLLLQQTLLSLTDADYPRIFSSLIIHSFPWSLLPFPRSLPSFCLSFSFPRQGVVILYLGPFCLQLLMLMCTTTSNSVALSCTVNDLRLAQAIDKHTGSLPPIHQLCSSGGFLDILPLMEICMSGCWSWQGPFPSWPGV